MAVAFESVQTASDTGLEVSETLTITKPTSTAEGDLLIAHFGATSRTGSANLGFATLSGWTSIFKVVDSGNLKQVSQAFYKVAGASEPASYTWQNSNGQESVAGAIYRITGAGGTALIRSSTENGTSPWNLTLTPDFADSLLLMLVATNDGDIVSDQVSGYAIANDNPTWTERYDISVNMDDFYGAGNPSTSILSGATASRTEISATGDASATIAADQTEGTIAALLIIPPVANVSLTGTTGNLTLDTTTSGSVAASAAVTGSTGNLTLSTTTSGTVSAGTSKVTNKTKSAAGSVTNKAKS